MWIEEFRWQYDDVIYQRTGQRQDLAQIEQKVQQVFARSGNRVDQEVLRAVASGDWSYRTWWHELSPVLASPVNLLPEFWAKDNKETTIELLLQALKHIEIVSVVLRFLHPDEFGIMSPPVINLLRLPPAENHVKYYLSYLDVLNEVRSHYKSEKLKRIADIDMAIWSAAIIQISGEKIDILIDLGIEMNRDDYFRGLCLRNLLGGLSSNWKGSDQEQLDLASAVLIRDHRTAARIASGPFQNILVRFARRLNISPDPRGRDESKLGTLARKLDGHPRLLELGLGKNRLKNDCRTGLWDLRNRTVHGHPDITPEQAYDFIEETKRLERLPDDW